MQKLDDGRIVFSASDLTSAAECEWGLARKLDKMLGHDIEVPKTEDAMMKRAGELGDLHEQTMLTRLLEQYPDGVAQFERPTYDDPSAPWVEQMTEVSEATLQSLRGKMPVVFQGAFFDGEFQGFADFLILNSDDEYEVNDTKLARKAKVTALIQLAAYADQLRANGIPTADAVHLLLGNGTTSTHNLRDIMPVYLKRRERMRALISERQANHANGGAPTPWNDPQYSACGKCAVCEPQIPEHDDLLAIAGMRMTQRAKLMAAGIPTLNDFAHTSKSGVEGMADRTFTALKAQAEVQLDTRNSSTPDIPVYRVHHPVALAAIPAPSPGDIFFDFEGDPLYQEGETWNLDYLFGYVDANKEFTALWAHDLAQEKQALIDFLAQVKAIRATHPDMHIYHYADYERAHLLCLAARHGVGEDDVDNLLRDNVLVDLYPIVKNALRIGAKSYSIKKLEPLYMGDDERSGVTNAADSVVEYANYVELLAQGRDAEASLKLKEIADYNKYDCISTINLRDWLLARARELDITPLPRRNKYTEAEIDEETDPLFDSLMNLIADVPVSERTDDQTAVALTAAAIDFHRRENKSFWWAHFTRLKTPLEDWPEDRDIFVVNSAEVTEDWHKPSARHNERRHILVQTTPTPGSKVKDGGKIFATYSADADSIPESGDPGSYRTKEVTVLRVLSESAFVIEETVSKGAEKNTFLPIAFTPTKPPPTKGLAEAIAEWGRKVLNTYPSMPSNASMDVLRRISPRGSGIVPIDENETYEAIRDSLVGMENSYVAVQGPPGAGKSYNGGHVIAELVQRGWKVGVVGQSHATVENLLRSVAKAGVIETAIGKSLRTGEKGSEVASLDDTTWTPLERSNIAEFLAVPGGRVFGGTVWDFSNTDRVERGQLDLLVIDEAGQYSLANTIAAAVSAKRLLLLGDPQQLPQVTQGTHPEPIDGSALGWLIDKEEVLPATLGYFLDTSWRMHADVCRVVSDLSYDGRLTSHPNDRHLDGVAPGFEAVPVQHSGNSTESVEEADAVVAKVLELLPMTWHEKGASTPLSEADENFIIVAPYNAQVNLIRTKLDAVGLNKIRVGTVDKFQGQEAAVAIVSLAASSAEDVPRGLEFLLMTNRLNVAVSRAKWASYLFYSPELTEYLPTNATDLKLLSRFINLISPI